LYIAEKRRTAEIIRAPKWHGEVFQGIGQKEFHGIKPSMDISKKEGSIRKDYLVKEEKKQND